MAKPGRVEARSYLDMARERPGDIARERECFAALLGHIDKGSLVRVHEVFGGYGVFRGAAERVGVLSPEVEYSVWDHSADCLALYRGRYPNTHVTQGDSFQLDMPWDCSLISADFNTWTPLKWYNRDDYRRLTDRIFGTGAEYVQLTDAAVNKLHLNHRSYAVPLMEPDWSLKDPQPYFAAVARWAYNWWGYGLVAVTYHSGAAYYLLTLNQRPVDIDVVKL